MFIEETLAKVAMNKSILKEYRSATDNRVVYLNDGSEFQIQLFNPYSFVIAAKIETNGQSSDSIILVRPGERLWIERPVGKQRKFKFETYTVEDSTEAKHAIASNGNIVVKFYKEVEKSSIETVRVSDPMIDYGYISSNYFINDDTVDDSYLTFNGEINEPTIMTNSKVSTASSYVTKLADSTVNNSIRCKSINNNNNTSYTIKPETSIETGRITSGSYSDQKFKEVNGYDFSSWAFKTEYIKLLPMSKKPYTSSDLQKIYCTECGRKISSKFKYCPHCGTKCLLDIL